MNLARTAFVPQGRGPPARSATKPRISDAPPRRSLIAQRAGAYLSATPSALRYTVQSHGRLSSASRRPPLGAQPRIVPLGGDAARFRYQRGAASSSQLWGLPAMVASCGARLLRPRARVPASLTRCAAKPFFGREEAVADLKSLLLGEPTSVTVLLGPRDCGKTELLRRVEEELQAGAQEPAPPHTGPSLTSSNPRPTLLHVDWLASDPAGLRYAAINAGIWPQIGAQVGLDSSLPALLGALRTYFEQCKAAGIVPVVVIDDARALMKWREEDQEALRELLNFFVAITQDKLAHVVLATADSFFPDWLQANGVDWIDVNVLGELPEDEARRYVCGDGEGGRWPGLVAQKQAPPLQAGTWAAVYAVCGGNMGLLADCVALAGEKGWSWSTALGRFKATGSENVMNGFQRSFLSFLTRDGSKPPAWTDEQYRAALRCIARAPHHAVRRSALERAMDGKGEEEGYVALRSLVQYGLLYLRFYSTQAWASDLPEEVYGEGPEAVVTIPRPSSLRHVLQMDRRGQLEAAAAGSSGGGGGEAASG